MFNMASMKNADTKCGIWKGEIIGVMTNGVFISNGEIECDPIFTFKQQCYDQITEYTYNSKRNRLTNFFNSLMRSFSIS